METPKSAITEGATAEKENKPSTKASWQAQVAFLLSIYSTAFGFYQWWASQQSDKIKQTLELSQKFLENKEIYRQGDAVYRWQESGTQWYAGQSYDDKDLQDRWNYMYYLEYVAMLTASNKLDISYMPKPLLCRLYIGGTSNRKLHQEMRLPPKFLNLETMVSLLSEDVCIY